MRTKTKTVTLFYFKLMPSLSNYTDINNLTSQLKMAVIIAVASHKFTVRKIVITKQFGIISEFFLIYI